MVVTFLTILHIIVSILLIVLVLVQSGKGADLGAVFGGGASQTLFGAGGGKTIMTKITVALATLFMLTSLLIATLPKTESSITQQKSREATKNPLESPDTTGIPSNVPVTPSTPASPTTSGTK